MRDPNVEPDVPENPALDDDDDPDTQAGEEVETGDDGEPVT